MQIPVALEAVLLTGAMSGGGWGLVLLSRISNTMGRIDERLEAHDDRLTRLEDTVDGASKGTFHSPRVGSAADLRAQRRRR